MGEKRPLQCTNKNENLEKDWHWFRMLLDQTEKICRLMLLWAIPVLHLLIYSIFYPIFQQMFNKYLWKICSSRFLIYISAIHNFFYRVKYVDRSEIETERDRAVHMTQHFGIFLYGLLFYMDCLHSFGATLQSATFWEYSNHRQIRRPYSLSVDA